MKLIKYMIGVTLAAMVVTGCQSGNETPETAATEATTEVTVPETTVVEEPVVEPEDVPLVPTFGGTLRVAMNPADTLDPLENQISSVSQLLALVNEPLFSLDNTLKPTPVLVESYSTSMEGKLLTLTLKPGISFHNGEALTAADVAYTINTIKESKTSPYKPLVMPIRRVSVSDELTLDLYYDTGYAFMLNDLTFPIVSEAYGKSDAYDPMKPVGTGPYVFTDYQLMQELTLTANENWHDGSLYVETIKAIAMNETSNMESLFDQHLIDLMNPAKFNWLKYSEKEDQRIESYITGNYTFLAFNDTEEEFSEVNFRKAIAHAIDRESLIYNQFINHAVISDTPVIPGSWFDRNDEEVVYTYDREAAMTYLESFDFVDSDDDGLFDVKDVLDAANVTPVTYKMVVNSGSPTRVTAAEAIAKDLEAIGFTIEIEALEGQAYYTAVEEKKYDLLLGGWQLSSKPDYASLFATDGVQNFVGYSSETMDSVLSAIVNAYDEEAVAANVEVFEALFIEEMPYVSLYFLEGAVMAHSSVIGDMMPTMNGTLNNVEDLYMNLTEE